MSGIGAYLAIAFGGALGSLARYAVTVAAARAWGPDFPWGTMVGFCGGFTSFRPSACRRLNLRKADAGRQLASILLSLSYCALRRFQLVPFWEWLPDGRCRSQLGCPGANSGNFDASLLVKNVAGLAKIRS